MKVTSDDKYLVTAGRDGCVMVFEIKDKDARGFRSRDGYSKFSEEILATKSDLDDLRNQKDNLNTQLQEFQNTQNMGLNQSNAEEKNKVLEEQIMTLKQSSNQSYDQLQDKKREMQKKLEEDMKQFREKNE